MNVNFPLVCPSCREELKVKSLKCDFCATEVNGSYGLPLLARLTSEEQDFILQFVKTGGSLKDMAKLLALSYPTVRNLLNDLIEKIQDYEN